jgi:hypothetical protein
MSNSPAVSRLIPVLWLAVALLASVFPARAQLTNRLVAYWPMNSVDGSVTPDVVSGYDMVLQNLTTNDLVPGRPGGSNCFRFNSTNQTLLRYVALPNDALPINKNPAFTVSMWIQVNGTNQTDLRVFGEQYFNGPTDPLWLIGTTGASGTTLDAKAHWLLRQRSAVINGTNQSPDIYDTQDTALTSHGVFDGTWHHLAVTMDTNGSYTVYVDGRLDPGGGTNRNFYGNPSVLPALPLTNTVTGGRWVWNFNSTSIGGVARNIPGSHWITGSIDDVAMWTRALGSNEVAQVYSNGIPTVALPPVLPKINSFTADYHEVAPGDTVTLRWDTVHADTISISPGIGDVTAISSSGIGSTNVLAGTNTTFVLTASRGSSNVTAQTGISILPGVAPGWHLLERFDSLPPSTLGIAGGSWVSDASDYSGPLDLFNVIAVTNGPATNHLLSAGWGQPGLGALCGLLLNSLTIPPGQSNTLFFRFCVNGGNASDIAMRVGLTDRSLIGLGDFVGDDGPCIRIVRNSGTGGRIDLQAYNGVPGYDTPTPFTQPAYTGSYRSLINTNGLQTDCIYDVWMHVQNLPFGFQTNFDGTTNALGDVYSVCLQKEGDTNQTLVFSNYTAYRLYSYDNSRGFPGTNLTTLFLAQDAGIAATNTVGFDDFFLTTNDFNAGLPISFRITGLEHAGASAGLTWNSFPPMSASATPTYTVQRKLSLSDSDWTTLIGGWASGGYATAFVDPSAPDPAGFYRVTTLPPGPAAFARLETEAGTVGPDFAVGYDGQTQYITIESLATTVDCPGNSNRVATYAVTFPGPGTYNLYAHIRARSAGGSFFYGNGFGIKSPANPGDWVTVNNVSQGGFVNAGDPVIGTGPAGMNVWKWINLSQFTNGSEAGITFTVPPDQLTQMFQIGAGASGLDLNAFVFGTADSVFTVASLDATASAMPPGPSAPRDLVSGNLIQFNDNGAWCWYQDERAVVDTARGKLIAGYMENGAGFGGSNVDGHVSATIFDLNNGTGAKYVLRNILLSYGGADDHNAPAFVVRPDGKYVALYTGHNNDDYSFWRIYDPVTDTWSDEQAFDWNTQPGGADFPTTYSNPYYLAAENRLYNFSRGNGHGGQNIMLSTNLGDAWSYGGQLTTNGNIGYVNGYFKYSGNGVDRVDFICTEYHPDDFNTSIYHGYVSNGMTFRSDGTLVDGNIFDKIASTPQSYTPVFLANTVLPAGQTNYRCWNDDVQHYPDGTVACIISARVNNNVSGGDTTNNPDHSFFYCRYDRTNWHATYLGRAGAKLFDTQVDYVGLGCLNPNDPNTIYVSFPYDPRDNVTFLGVHEIFKGTTTDHGLTWTWTPITRNSTRDNLRPIMPAWDENDNVLLWYRGNYTSLSFDSAVVGIVDRNAETVGPMSYVDATNGNTTFADGSPLVTGDTAGQWHERVGPGNSGSLLASADVNAETALTIETTATVPGSGTYDVWANFWGSPGADWRIVAGLSTNQMQVFRQMASRLVEPGDHDSTLVLTNGSNAFLYQAYLGRVQLSTNTSVSVFVDSDALQTGTVTNLIGDTARTWYDGISFARVDPLQIVNAAIDPTGSTMTLTWNTTPPARSLTTRTYTVQKKNLLTDPAWTPIATGLIPSGSLISFTVTNSGASAGVYRIASP